jgi:hypothetical protein
MSLSKLTLGLVLLLPLAVGCGGGPSVGAIPATGVVTLDGKPVDGATISFVPDSDEARSASGLTDATGVFRLTSLSPGDGAVPGRYKVAISKLTSGPAEEAAPTSQEEAMKQIQDKSKQGGSSAFYSSTPNFTVKETLPERYSDAKTSGLNAEVKKGSDNKFTFALTTSG